MIVTTVTSPARTSGAGSDSICWRSLARRGMLHSESESFDHVRLAPGTEFALCNRYATEQVWFVLRGTGVVSSGPEDATNHPLHASDLVLAPHDGSQIVLRASSAGLEVLCLTVLPAAVTMTLPPRKPEIS
ncbi:MAG: cupin domain-containing protein [Pseudonocardiales bacterium]